MKKNLVSSMLSAAMVLSLAASMTSHASVSALLKQDASVVTDKTVKTGTLLISVNPEIKMDYNYKGRALKLSGMNESGRAVVRDMKNYQYDPCDEVMEDRSGKSMKMDILIQKRIILQKTFLLSWKQVLRLPTVSFWKMWQTAPVIL